MFDLDAGGDVSVKLDARLNSGSGSGDMVLLVPDSAFAGADPNSFVYLYSKIGGQAGATANGGFEEWAVRAAPPVSPPQVGTASLSGRVLVDPGRDTVNGDEFGIEGVTIQLRLWMDGVYTVVATTKTDVSGSYRFTGLSAGKYEIIEVDQPTSLPDGRVLEDGDDYLGTVNNDPRGDFDPDRVDAFTAIQLFDGEQGVEFNFTEWLRTG